jgi:hypothetical protein
LRAGCRTVGLSSGRRHRIAIVRARQPDDGGGRIIEHAGCDRHQRRFVAELDDFTELDVSKFNATEHDVTCNRSSVNVSNDSAVPDATSD